MGLKIHPQRSDDSGTVSQRLHRLNQESFGANGRRQFTYGRRLQPRAHRLEEQHISNGKQNMKEFLDNLERIPFRTSADPMNEGIPPFTGDKEVEFRGNYDTDGFIFVRQTQPLPLTILSLYPRLVTNDG